MISEDFKLKTSISVLACPILAKIVPDFILSIWSLVITFLFPVAAQVIFYETETLFVSRTKMWLLIVIKLHILYVKLFLSKFDVSKVPKYICTLHVNFFFFFMPFPSMNSKWFWTVQIILVEYQLLWTSPICFGWFQIIKISPEKWLIWTWQK